MRPRRTRGRARGRRRRLGGERAPGRWTLSDAWRRWLVENLLSGVAPAELLVTLASHGVPDRIARRELAALQSSPAMDACRARDLRVRQLELVAKLGRVLEREGGVAIQRRAEVSADEFYERYYGANRPVVLTDVASRWRARELWTPAHFRARFADAEVEVCTGRAADPMCDANYEDHLETMTMAAYVDRVLAAGVSNDVYMIAHNRTLQQPPFDTLLKDICPDPDYFDMEDIARSCSLWFGPEGTVTPLHHDTCNILFCQIYGRKRVRMIAPHHTLLLDHAWGFYNRLEITDPQLLDRERVSLVDVELQPGEALFIPAGWWHDVRSLAVSITFSLLNFRRRNDFGWYKPGSL